MDARLRKMFRDECFSVFDNKSYYLIQMDIWLRAAFWPTFLAVEKVMVAAGETIL
jgi:hypothetical protein